MGRENEWATPRSGNRAMGHTYTNLLVHIIFSTKDRRPNLNPEIKARLFPYMAAILRDLGGKALAINGPADHVHLLGSLGSKHAVAEVVGKLKANSSKWIHETFPAHSWLGWQTGYAAFSVSHSQEQIVHGYIARQEEHHRKISFKEELLTFLKKHGVSYDERYLWG
jgi:REP element-mobilizing transposase RayT